jgi:exodeoxyribonuclease VII large subunit
VNVPLPFGPAGLDPSEVWSVSDLNQAARVLLEQNMPPVWVRGEVTSFKSYASGHWYFTLQDGTAQVRCVMWRTWAQRAKSRPEEGAEVHAFGTPGLWEEKGEFRFTATVVLRSDQLGQQQQQVEATRAALARDGLLDPSTKRPLPRYAATLAVVTSMEGAALHDIVTVAQSRWPAIRILVVGARVQGNDAVSELVRALRLVNRLDADVCIVGRGGGAREDLGAFNDERVCRALAAVKVPTISAVGHENDISLCDLVADVRAATPSNAAELAVPDQREVRSAVDGLALRLAGGLTRRTRLVSERLARTGDRLESAVGRVVRHQRHRLERIGAQLDALSPLRVLERGFAVPISQDGRVLRSRSEFGAGQRYRLRVRDGEVPSRVEDA